MITFVALFTAMNLHYERHNYYKAELTEETVAADPFTQFGIWYQDARASAIKEANAMVIATATPDGKPSARIVLLKEFSKEGFVFFTNYDSRKGQEVRQNPQAQILFFWDILERQVRIEGRLEHIAPERSDEYFDSRPIESRYGAIASPQSAVVPSRTYLEVQLAEAHMEPPVRPAHWGGYVLVPDYFEFWQGRPSRMHDRIFYRLQDGRWTTGRLAP